MNNDQLDNTLVNGTNGPAKRPQFLNVLCILSFISCGLWIVLYAFGTMLLGVKEETVAQMWEKAQEMNPQLDSSVDPAQFFHAIGMVCLYGLFLNVVSLLGAVMMWRLNKIGFFIYVFAELAINFTGYLTDLGKMGDSSMGQTVFWIVVDIIFIVMYAVNLKYMNANNEQPAS